MEIERNLIGVDRRGGQGYQEVPCEICGGNLFISKNAESGICARCVVMGYLKPKNEINIPDVARAIKENSLRQYRKKNGLSQDTIARFLEISRMHYWRIEKGRSVGKNIMRKIEKKLAQVEQGQ